MEDWTPKPGELVQIWDHTADSAFLRLLQHGTLGYVVGESKDKKESKAGAYRIICFGNCDNPTVGEIINVNKEWLIPINKSSDIKKVEDD